VMDTAPNANGVDQQQDKENKMDEKADDDKTDETDEKMEEDRGVNVQFSTVKRPGMQFITVFKYRGKSIPIYTTDAEAGRVMRYFNIEETEEEKEDRLNGERFKIFVPNLYGQCFKKADINYNRVYESSSESDDTSDDVPDLMETSYEPRKHECQLMPTTLAERERAEELERLEAASPDYRSEIDRRLEHMRNALKTALEPNYEKKVREAQVHRAHRIFWSEAWKAMPAATEMLISLARPSGKDHTIITLDEAQCGHINHPRVFHVLLPQVFATFDQEWRMTKELKFKEGFLNFLAVFMEHGYHYLSLSLGVARGEFCYNQ